MCFVVNPAPGPLPSGYRFSSLKTRLGMCYTRGTFMMCCVPRCLRRWDASFSEGRIGVGVVPVEGIVPLLPMLILCAGFTLVLGSRRLARGTYSGHIALSASLLAFACTIYAYYLARSRILEVDLLEWAPVPGHTNSLLYRVDSWSALFAVLALATVLAAMLLRTRLWLAFPHRTTWTDAYLLGLGAVFTHLVYSASPILVTASWICLGLVACVGSISSSTEPEVRDAAHKTLVMTCVSGCALIAASISIGRVAGYSLGFANLSPGQISLPAFLLLVVALACYAGQFPLHVWATALGSVPSTFASAGSVVTGAASIYVLGRLSFVFDLDVNPGYAIILIAVGLASVAYGSASAWVESDINKLLRHICMVELGFAFVAFGLGSPAALVAAALIAINLFLSGGAVALHVLELRGRGVAGESSLLLHTPLEVALALAALASLVGAPPLLGFFARWILYNAAVDKGYGAVAVIGILASALSIVPSLKWADQLLFGRSHLRWSVGWRGLDRPSVLSLSAVGVLLLPGLALGLLPWLSLRHVVIPSLASAWAGAPVPLYSAVFDSLGRLSTPILIVTALGVLVPFGVGLALYPFPLGRWRLRASAIGLADQGAEPDDSQSGIRVGLEIGAQSIRRMFNPESGLWLLKQTANWVGAALFDLEEHVAEKYYFPALLLLAIGLVFVFLD